MMGKIIALVKGKIDPGMSMIMIGIAPAHAGFFTGTSILMNIGRT